MTNHKSVLEYTALTNEVIYNNNIYIGPSIGSRLCFIIITNLYATQATSSIIYIPTKAENLKEEKEIKYIHYYESLILHCFP